MSNALLPPELERHVFEITAFLHPSSRLRLLLVAHRVKIWIEPLLYTVLTIGAPNLSKGNANSSSLSMQTLSNLMDGKPASFFRDHVRHIYFMGSAAAPILRILSVCDAIEDLNLPLEMQSPSTLAPVLAALPLRRMSILWLHFFPARTLTDSSHPLFTHLTHLEVNDWVTGVSWDEWAGLVRVPRLSHLSFPSYIDNETCQAVLRHCKALEVLVVVCFARTRVHISEREELGLDARFVLLVVSDSHHEWEMGARGGMDYWVRADVFVKKRRAGEVKGCFLGN
ncbi:hypothetical protein K438DRAFT_1836520 [Mycena galopus ATCC 62051]|nr:hypothetical protein K438DRAFT_1844780 [Mycena galopus ATCC 62051]KAF8185932.1 hypothetical protein K438DRAFT_1836520 [Mycena galopus ATCC 62051]